MPKVYRFNEKDYIKRPPVETVDAERMVGTEFHALTETDGITNTGDALLMHSEDVRTPKGLAEYIDHGNPMTNVLSDIFENYRLAKMVAKDQPFIDLDSMALCLGHLFQTGYEKRGEFPNTDEMIAIDTPKQMRFNYPSGSFAQALQTAPNQWRLQISSGKARDERVTVLRMFEGEKGNALITLANMALDGIRLRRHLFDTLAAAVNQYRAIIDTRVVPLKSLIPDPVVTVEDVEPPYRNIVHLTHTHTDGFFERVFKILQYGPAQLEQMGLYGNNTDFIYKTEETLGNFFGAASPPSSEQLAKAAPPYFLDRWELSQLNLALIYDLWFHIQATHLEKTFEEMTATMAKNSGLPSEKVWFFIEGGDTSINKLANTLQSNRHEIVRDTSKAVYLNVQFSEKKFVEGVVKRFNCHMALIDPPPFDVAICGVKSTHVDRHQIECNSCKREQLNREARERKAAADAAAAEAELATQKAARANLQAVKDEPAVPSMKSPDGMYQSGIGTMLPNNPIIPPARTTAAQEVAENKSKNGPVKIVTPAGTRITPTAINLTTEFMDDEDKYMDVGKTSKTYAPIGAHPKARIQQSQLYNLFTIWCEVTGKKRRISAQQFNKVLTAQYDVELIKVNGLKTWRGIGYIHPAIDLADQPDFNQRLSRLNPDPEKLARGEIVWPQAPEQAPERPERTSIVLSAKLPEGMDITDLQGTADYYAKLSDEHQAAAAYYENLSLKMYEFLQEPAEPEEVRLAREALERATAEATQQRAVQFDELKALLTGD